MNRKSFMKQKKYILFLKEWNYEIDAYKQIQTSPRNHDLQTDRYAFDSMITRQTTFQFEMQKKKIT